MPSANALSTADQQRWCSTERTRKFVAFCLLTTAVHVHAAGDCQPPAQAVDPEIGPKYQVDASLSFDDNLSRGRLDSEVRSGWSTSAVVFRSWSTLFNPNTCLILTGTAGGVLPTHYHQLANVFGQVDATLQYRPSGNFYAPTFRLITSASTEDFRSTIRGGEFFSLRASATAALTSRISTSASIGYDQSHAPSAVFSSRSRSARFDLDYVLSDTKVFYLGWTHRRGDTVGSGFESLENIDIATVFVQDDAFRNDDFISYRFDGTTNVITLGFNYAFDTDAAIDLTWQYGRSTADRVLPFASHRYVSNRLTASVAWRF